jgi:hypothetical protein
MTARCLAVRVPARALCAALLLAGARVQGQGVAVSTSVQPTLQSWSFSALPSLDSVRVRGVTQFSVPVQLQLSIGDRWLVEAITSYASSTLTTDGGRDSLASPLSGPSDVRLRAVGRVFGERVLLTTQVNVPTGRTLLTRGELTTVEVTASPALETTVPVLGTGLAASVGAVFGWRRGAWALGAGASLEQRGQYQPVEARALGLSGPLTLAPGTVTRVSLAGDRLVGEQKLALFFATDFFGSDRVDIVPVGGTLQTRTYRLGPSVAFGGEMTAVTARFRSVRTSIVNRTRFAFQGPDGKPAAGSSGNRLDFSIKGVRGRPGRRALLLSLGGRFDTGLAVDQSIATAAMSAVSIGAGVEWPVTSVIISPSAALEIGRLDTGRGAAMARGITFSGAIRAQ